MANQSAPSSRPKILLSNLFWGLTLWLFGYVLGVVFFFVVPKELIGFFVMPFGVAATLWVLLKKISREQLLCYFGIGLIWTILAVVLDYLLIVVPFRSSDYYKPDVYAYYVLTFVLPVAVGCIKFKKYEGLKKLWPPRPRTVFLVVIIMVAALAAYQFALIYRLRQAWCAIRFEDAIKFARCEDQLEMSISYDLCRRIGKADTSVTLPSCQTPRGNFVSKFSASAWRRYIEALNNCEVIGRSTAHSGEITATLKDGSEIRAVVPKSSPYAQLDGAKASQCPKLQFIGIE